MFTLNNDKILRNLEEQVQYLSDYHKVNQGLAQWGIRVIGQVETPEQLPSPETYQGQYGDAYAVGTEAPFNFYIWTRASVVGDLGYWFPFGEISIVGPQGPKGDKGDKGDTGESTKWYVFGFPPTYVTGDEYQEGDMSIVLTNDSNNGTVWRYGRTSQSPIPRWTQYGNIKGPQGIQGIQGVQGVQGPQGPQGIQGEKGDVGGFINIVGTLSSTDQLPLPSTLDNLTYAYLVEHTGGSDQAEDHNDLYIQVGETSDEAVWFNAGPFNAATLVTVNGEGQNVWDADTKLDKNTTADGYYNLYAKTGTGGQYMQRFTHGVVPDAIVSRDSRGIFKLPADASLYTNSDDAVSKAYVDAAIAALRAELQQQ